jgi:2-amino-4-hydroxy-6-hydroxymethyldihydropteridine diphosphokinase
MTTAAHTGADPKIHRVYLGLGSNVGDRDAQLRSAISALAAAVHVERVSSVYDTAPLLVTEQRRFHNMVCMGATDLEPLALLYLVKELERRAGRVPGPRFGPRPLDIDILLYDELVQATPELTLPHPEMAKRAFVLAPLAEIAPDVRHPTLGTSMAELLIAVGEADVRRIGPL